MIAGTTKRMSEADMRRRLAVLGPVRLKKGLCAKAVQYVSASYSMTQEQIGKMLEVDQGFISRVASGKRNLTVKHLERLSQAVGLPPAILLWKASASDAPSDPKKRKLFAAINGLVETAYPGPAEQSPRRRRRIA
jgi:transcriptional regulator with XRE-family HTH domain